MTMILMSKIRKTKAILEPDSHSQGPKVMLKTLLNGIATVGFVGLLASAVHAETPAVCVIDGGQLALGPIQTCVMPADLAGSPIRLRQMTMGYEARLVLPPMPNQSADQWNILVKEGSFGDGVVIDARGMRGMRGYPGNNGQSQGVGAARDCQFGRRGETGGHGAPGSGGQNIVLDITFASLGSLEVDTTGGDGGNGGRGGAGQRGGKADANVSDPCRGGDRGDGGDGGTITATLTMRDGTVVPLDRLSFSYSGGKPGKPGSPGRPGAGGSGIDMSDWGVLDGEWGRRRSRGHDGGTGLFGLGGQHGVAGNLVLRM